MGEIIDLSWAVRRDRGRRPKDVEPASAMISERMAEGCPFRCARCGQIRESDSVLLSPYPLCFTCNREYHAYVRREADEAAPWEAFWHNEQWLQMWRNWLKYRQSMDDYHKSREFALLFNE